LLQLIRLTFWTRFSKEERVSDGNELRRRAKHNSYRVTTIEEMPSSSKVSPVTAPPLPVLNENPMVRRIINVFAIAIILNGGLPAMIITN
jgi:hypothetical protein